MKTILFVCTGNICRSPMAAAIMHRRISELGLADAVQVLSAGVYAEAGYGASRFATSVLGQRGMDLTVHRSQGLTLDLLKTADLVLVMEEGHRKSIFYLAPQALSKVFLLTEMTGEHADVADPYGGTVEEYLATANLLEQLIDAGLPHILKRLSLQSKMGRG